MTYREAIDYLNSFVNYENFLSFDYKEALRLDRMRKLAARLGNPQDGIRCIHIAGTKGKGSTAAMTASILKEAGFRVGLYTSPHLISFRERIKINDEPISEDDIRLFTGRLKEVIDHIDEKCDEFPTFFEVYTALAFLYFKEKGLDLCVIEVGMGGRLDATNIVKPLCCAITQLSLEHTQKLGNTISLIASEKAGIIKDGGVCVSSPQEPEAQAVIRKASDAGRCRLFEVGKDITFRNVKGQHFFVKGIFDEYADLTVGLLGDHQFINASTAIGLVESLRFYDIIVTCTAIRDGLRKVQWPGRLQVFRTHPFMILDGAQNRASAKALKEAVKKIFSYDRLILVLGICKDKDIKGVCEELEPISDEIILTKASLPRAQEPYIIRNYIGKNARLTANVDEAMNLAQRAASGTDLILVTGSFYVIGEVMQKSRVKS